MRKVYDFLLILKAEIIRDFIFMKRYPLEPISFLFFMYLILLAILFGFNQLAGGVASLNKEKMILGYSLMQFVMATQMGWSGQIQNESQTGTLEQLSISGHSLGEVLMARGFSQLPRQTISFYALLSLYVMSVPNLKFQLLNTIPLTLLYLFVFAIGIFGLSFIFAGLTLLFKRVGFFFQIINFAFLGLFWQDRSSLPDGGILAFLYDHFPLSMGMFGMQDILTNKGMMNISLFLEFTIHCLVFCVLGFIAFYLMEKKARKEGLLSQY
ncbi:MAG: hypothetical protein SFU98_16275 [Leptospiraceae bacterium]|nr:hypothetical protein [Leptospiraceae bacterium]